MTSDIDRHIDWVDQVNDHMDCGCYNTLKSLAAEVERLRRLIESAGLNEQQAKDSAP